MRYLPLVLLFACTAPTRNLIAERRAECLKAPGKAFVCNQEAYLSCKARALPLTCGE